jgi:hypothetical protein
MEWAPVYHVKGGENSNGTMRIFAPALTGPTRLTPKVHVLLDFLDEYIGTDRDPRLEHNRAKGYFTDRKLAPTSGP